MDGSMEKMKYHLECHSQLEEIINRYKNKNIVILGMGNDIMGDDQVGGWIVEQLRSRLPKVPNSWLLLNVHVVPDNYVGKIIKWSPDVMIIFDAYRPFQFASDQKPPSVLFLKDLNDFPEGFTTHNISLKNWIKFIEFHCQKDIEILFCGILGRNFEFGNEKMSDEVKQHAELIVEAFLQAVERFIS